MNAMGLVAAANSDANNVFITLTAKGMRSDIFVLARALEEKNEEKLLMVEHFEICQQDLVMKRIIKNINQFIVGVSLIFWLAIFWWLLLPSAAIGELSVADEIISLEVTERPLGEVLEEISISADCQFSIEESWKDYPITASFDSEPLSRALKLMFRNINNAVIYGADRTVRIIIYGEGRLSGKTIDHSYTIKSSQEPIQHPQQFSDTMAPQPEVEIFEGNNDADNSEQQLEETADSSAETNEAEADSTETSEGESADASSGKETAASEAEGNDSGTEEENNQSE
jgi:hypothetical protein